MRKLSKKLTSIFSIFTFIILVSGCSNQLSENIKEKSYSASANDIEEINISVKDRKIKIIPSTDDEIRISYYENEKEFYTISMNENGILSMQSESDRDISDYFGISSPDSHLITLEIPSSFHGNMVIKTTNNNIILPEIHIAGDLNIDINNGDILLNKLFVQKNITLHAKNGGISGILNGSYDDFEINSEARKGNNNLPTSKEGGNKTLTATTNNGDINIVFEK